MRPLSSLFLVPQFAEQQSVHQAPVTGVARASSLAELETDMPMSPMPFKLQPSQRDSVWRALCVQLAGCPQP